MYKYIISTRIRTYVIYTVQPQPICGRMERIYVSTLYTYAVFIQTIYTDAVYTHGIHTIYTEAVYTRLIPYICETSPKKAIYSKC